MPAFSSLLLDRDGTIIKDKHYLADPAGVELLPGVGDALAALGRQGMRFFLVSNQSGVGRGMFGLEAVLACNERLTALLAPYGVRFADMIFCPHAPEEKCSCRKPATGMWRALEQRHGLDAAACLMIGDKEEDMRFAAAAGLAGRILVLTGKGEKTAHNLGLEPSADAMRVNGTPAVPCLPWLRARPCASATGRPRWPGCAAPMWLTACSGNWTKWSACCNFCNRLVLALNHPGRR